MGSPMAGMDFKIPTVLTSEELMEKAFHRASKIRKNGTGEGDRVGGHRRHGPAGLR